jgi:hypothetical protein
MSIMNRKSETGFHWMWLFMIRSQLPIAVNAPDTIQNGVELKNPEGPRPRSSEQTRLWHRSADRRLFDNENFMLFSNMNVEEYTNLRWKKIHRQAQVR